MTLRELFINWLTASRFIHSLESRISEQRQDYTERLAEKDKRINELRTEISSLKIECDRMRSVLMPFGSPAGATFASRYDTPAKPAQVPVFSGPDSWEAELNKVLKEEEDGIRKLGRQEVHQPSADDGAQQVSVAHAGQV